MRKFALERGEFLAVLLAVVLAGMWMHPYRAQQASRYALTAAIAERGTVVLDEYEAVIGIDRAVRDGRIYSDKAPAQPFLAVPVYMAYRSVGGQPGDVLKVERHVGLWWLTLWFAAVPLGVLTVVMKRHLWARGLGRVAWPVSLALTYGTLLLPFGGLLFGHALAALLLAATFLLVDRSEASRWRLLAAGGTAALAVATEYPAILAVAPLLAYALWLHRARVGWVIAGGAPVALLLGVYNTVAFGGPLNLSYRFSAFSEVTETARPIGELFGPLSPANLTAQFTHPRGLFVATPIVLLAIVGLWALWKRFRPLSFVCAAVIAGHLGIVAFWGNPWGGDSPGARYFVPAIPFLALPLALLWKRIPRVGFLLAGVGAVVMFASIVTDPLLPRDTNDGAHTWLTWLARGLTAPTVVGSSPAIPWMLLALAVLLTVVLVRRSALRTTGRPAAASES